MGKALILGAGAVSWVLKLKGFGYISGLMGSYVQAVV